MSIYESGSYLVNNPSWHVEDSPFKVARIMEILGRNNISPGSICEIGCGAGEILRLLQADIGPDCLFRGYEVSPQAYEMCSRLSSKRLEFRLGDISDDKDFFDLALMIDVLEHIEDFYGMLAKVKEKARYKVIIVPLELNVLNIIRNGVLTRIGNKFGHIHHFYRETFLKALTHAGYTILDCRYNANYLLPNRNLRARVMRYPRSILFRLNSDFTVKTLGGYSLMVLAE